jgi:penicillin-binding protein 1A
MKNKIQKAIYALLGLGLLGAILVVIVVALFNLTLPKISNLSDYRPSIPSRILAKDGTLLAEIGKEKRYVAEINEIPKRIIDAVVSAEDSGFFEHQGVEFLGMLRALLVNIRKGRYAQGGSTITQQVAKSLLLTNERSIARKIKDMLLAQKIEKRFSKDEILYIYLNQVYLGGGYYGVKAAFDGYFDKDLKEATVAEAAMVAGLLVAPGKYSPYINPKRAKIRQGYVLGRMLENKKITKEEYDLAVAEETKFRLRKSGYFLAGHFTDWVRQRLVSLVGEKEFLRDGYIVKTTIDYELQEVAEKSLVKLLKEIDKRQGYKGALRKIEKDYIKEWVVKQRESFIKDQSNYFTIDKEYQKLYEVTFDDTFGDSYTVANDRFNIEVKNKRFKKGNYKNDKVLEFVKIDEEYKAIVTGVDNKARVIYVNAMGLSGIIKYDNFKWAHKREISTERNYYGNIRNPSEITEVGDVILVSLKKKSSTLSSAVDKSFKTYLKKLDKKKRSLLYSQRYCDFTLDQKPDVEGALVSIAPFSGELISMVGGYDFKKSQFNRAIQSKRQPGSSFKPLLYAAAIENGYNPATIIIDSPETLGGVDASLNWKPRNYDGKFKGPITLRNSLEQSRNVTTIKMADDLGVEKIVNFMERIGFNADLDKDLSLALGSFGVTLMDIVSTYAVFPNGGLKVKTKSIISISDREGNEVAFDENQSDLKPLEEVVSDDGTTSEKNITDAQDKLEPKVNLNEDEQGDSNKNPYLSTLNDDQVYDRRLAYIMTNLLKGVVHHGTGRGARSVSPYLGGKTGTTNNYVDAWFIGFSQKLATGVWTGFDDNGTLGWGETGAKSALPLWRDYMQASIRKYGESDFQVPLGIVNVPIDKNTGKPIKDKRKASFIEAFVEGDIEGNKNADKAEDADNPNAPGAILEDDDYYNNQ